MSAYMIIEARVVDRERMAAYARAVPALVDRFGGEYLVLGGEHEPLEGNWGETRVVVSRWPSMAAARAFWHSEEYAEVRRLREGAGEFRVMLVEGLSGDGSAS